MTLRRWGEGDQFRVAEVRDVQLLVGVSLAHLCFNGHGVSTVGDSIGNNPQVVFTLMIDTPLAATSVAVACLVGLVGGIFPAVRAARMPIAAALRAA